MPHSPTHRPFYDEWLKSPFSGAENFIPYKEWAAVRIRKDAKEEVAKAKKVAADARKTLKQARRAVAGSE
jgi:hypothetical protein